MEGIKQEISLVDILTNCKGTILIIDDNYDDQKQIYRVLIDSGYSTIIAESGKIAITILEEHYKIIDTILLDIEMPVWDGFKVCKHIKNQDHAKDIPIIFINSNINSSINKNNEIMGLELGALHYLAKPLKANTLVPRIKMSVQIRQDKKILKEAQVNLKHQVEEKTAEVNLTQKITIRMLAKSTEFFDSLTGKHLDRIQTYTKLLATDLKENSIYCDYLGRPNYIDELVYASILHDVGKMGIPSEIIKKPGLLDEEEFNIIKRHPEYGGKLLKYGNEMFYEEFKKDSWLALAREIAYNHHERWDGKGYPKGKKETEIPLSARIVSVADVYDVITSVRYYKEAKTHEIAIKEITDNKGLQFDPLVVDAFLNVENQFNNVRISNQHFTNQAW